MKITLEIPVSVICLITRLFANKHSVLYSLSICVACLVGVLGDPYNIVTVILTCMNFCNVHCNDDNDMYDWSTDE